MNIKNQVPIYLAALVLLIAPDTFAQRPESRKDSLQTQYLDSVTVNSYLNQTSIKALPDIQGLFIFSGKKSEQIDVAQSTSNITDKTGRQIFARIPGIFVYDMDGAGNQINVSTRGLDPHRGWEFNIRKDGIITNSDMYGYPASHYSMPLESIDHISLVRGTGSLQYGAQFGGMLNYVSKTGDTTRPFSFESINSIGNFNLLSTYNAIGGKKGKLSYYAYLSKKSRGGFRDNEHTDSEAEYVMLNYQASSKFSAKVEWSRSKYLYRIPGPLSDEMFNANPRQATRSRNYFSPDIHVPAITLDWTISNLTRLQFVSSAVLGSRSSVQYDKPANIADSINKATSQFNNRQVDIDQFHSYTQELKVLQQYRLANRAGYLVAGIQYMNNDLHRRQLGVGTTGSDYNLTLVNPAWGRDLHFKTKNWAVYAENNFWFSKTLSLNIGARAESGETNLSGIINYYPESEVPVKLDHHFPLFGANFSYQPLKTITIYGGIAQAYRSMLFKDLIPVSVYEKIDPSIKDARGYNAELGFRGSIGFLKWDFTAYLLQYDNRFGTISLTDNSGNFYTYRTNIGSSLTKGLEMYVQASWNLTNKLSASAFTSTSVTDPRYTEGMVKAGNANVNVKGNLIESAPQFISRNGATVRYSRLTISGLFSYTSKTYADALNTAIPLAGTGATGLVPAYGIFDLNAGFNLSGTVNLKLSINNVADKKYFTKRPTFYPGPGIWPSDGRSMVLSFGIKL